MPERESKPDRADPTGEQATPANPGGRRAQHPPDADVVRRMRAGDADALRTLMHRYDRLVRYAVYRTARDHCRRDPDWLDARASETWTGFVRSLQRAGTRPPDDLPTYLLQIARNKCLDSLRIGRALTARTASEGEADVAQLLSPQEDTPTVVGRLEEMEALRDCIARLTPDDRRLCEHYELIVERRWKEAAQRLDIPESTLRTRWPGVLGRLRECLAKKSKKIPEKPAPPPSSPDP